MDFKSIPAPFKLLGAGLLVGLMGFVAIGQPGTGLIVAGGIIVFAALVTAVALYG